LIKRTFILVALLALGALTITACGSGSSAEDKITETIEKAATTSDPSNCTELETRNFVEQNSATKGAAAVKSCEKEAEAGKEEAEGVNVENVSVDGSKATAEVEFEGGPLGSQSLEMGLLEAGGNWKLDQVEGFAKYDGGALGAAFEKQFEESPEGLDERQANCIAQRIARSSKARAEELFFSGSSKPIVELAEGCA
jgi:hypothetical protein